jgi:4-hydroxybenzoate polyprenyltransferase
MISSKHPMLLISLLRLGRVSNLPTVWTNVLAGAVLAGAAWSDWRLGAVLTAMSLFYIGGMYLNDYFDRSIDAEERPDRPIPSGAIRAATVAEIGFGLLGVGLIVTATIGASASGFALLLVAAIVTYDYHHKSNPLGPVLMGACRTLVYGVAAAALSDVVPVTVVALAGSTIGAYVAGLSYAARQESVNEIKSFWPLLLLGAPMVFAINVWQQGLAAISICLLVGAWLGAAIYVLVRRPSPGSVPRAVGRLIAGISLCDALVMASVGAIAPAGAAIAAFLVTLLGHKYIAGT